MLVRLPEQWVDQRMKSGKKCSRSDTNSALTTVHSAALDSLLDGGHIYTTLDESHYAVSQ